MAARRPPIDSSKVMALASARLASGLLVLVLVLLLLPLPPRNSAAKAAMPGGSDKLEGATIGQPVAQEVAMVNGEYSRDVGVHRQPVQGRVGQVHHAAWRL